jgi:hypothetical protein
MSPAGRLPSLWGREAGVGACAIGPEGNRWGLDFGLRYRPEADASAAPAPCANTRTKLAESAGEPAPTVVWASPYCEVG